MDVGREILIKILIKGEVSMVVILEVVFMGLFLIDLDFRILSFGVGREGRRERMFFCFC